MSKAETRCQEEEVVVEPVFLKKTAMKSAVEMRSLISGRESLKLDLVT